MNARRILARSLLLLALLPSLAVAADTLALRRVHSFHRGDASSVFDVSRRHLIVVGGVGGEPGVGLEVLDLAGFPTWRRPEAIGLGPPSDLRYAPAIYDPLRDRMIVLEGSTMWSLSLAEPMTWTNVQPAGPVPTVFGAEVVYDSLRDRLVGFGRDGANSETWTLSLGPSPTWAALPFAGAVPPWRAQGVAVYDAPSDRMVVACGLTPSGDSNDAWQLTFAGGIPTWNPLVIAGVPPSPRHEPVYAYDPVARTILLYGGLNGSGPLVGGAVFNLAINAWQSMPTAGQPEARGGAAAAWDSTSASMIVAGGVLSAATNPPVAGDAWRLSSVWSRLPHAGGQVTAADFAGYDVGRSRFAAVVKNSPAFLSTRDSVWTLLGPECKTSTTAGGSFYVPVPNLLGVFSRDSLWTIHPGTDAAWTRTGTTGDKPPFVTPGTEYQDHAHHRVLVFGGLTLSLTMPVSSTDLYAFDYLTATWSIVAGSAIGNRQTTPVFDTKRNRLLLFSGAQLRHNLPPSVSTDFRALDLNTLVWTSVTAGGTAPTPRYDFAAAFDAARDRMLVFGGTQYNAPQRGVYDLVFSAGNLNGTWTRNDPVGEPVPNVPGIDGAYDAGSDRFFVPGTDHLYELSFGPPQRLILAECPTQRAWTPGAILPLTFSVSQSQATPRDYVWTIRSTRSWPGFPLQGFQHLADTSRVDIGVGIPVPDSAANGLNVLEFTIAEPSGADTCLVAIGDVSSPALWTLLEARAEAGHVRVAWWTSDRSGSAARIERRDASDSWQTLAVATIGGDGIVRVEDDDVVTGARYAYRVSVPGLPTSDEAWVDVPAARLAFDRPGMVIRGDLEVAFTLPTAAPIAVDAFDVAGRRVAHVEASGLSSGGHSLRLAAAGALRPGVYFLRLTQKDVRASGRAVVLP